MPMMIGADKGKPKSIAALIVAAHRKPVADDYAQASQENLRAGDVLTDSAMQQDYGKAGEVAARGLVDAITSGDPVGIYKAYKRLHEITDAHLEQMEGPEEAE